MDWKENIGKSMSDNGSLRTKYLNDQILEPLLKSFVDYLNEFDGMQGCIEKYSHQNGREGVYARVQSRYRLEILYPNDDILFGKFCDHKNRRFIAELFFTKKGLHIELYYLRRGGPFLEQRYVKNPKNNENHKTTDAQKEKNIKKIFQELSDNYKARDIYYNTFPIADAMDENALCNYLYFLYQEHIKHVDGTKKNIL